jgi:hypothetical protein
MADSISSIPMSISAMTGDHHPRRDQRQDEAADETKAAAAQAEDNRAEATAGAPVLDEPPVEAETLFSASVLGQRLRSIAADLQALNATRERDWSPPESALRLKDKSI